MAGFTKLDSGIIHSSLWGEDSDTRIVWVTLMASANAQGVVRMSVPGLARAAVVPLEKVEAALTKFSEPDPYSRTVDADGRRIEPVDGGWRLINYPKYRLTRDEEAKREADRLRQRKHRSHAMSRVTSQSVTHGHTESRGVAQAEAEAEAERETGKNSEPNSQSDLGLCQQLWERQEQLRSELASSGLGPYRARGGIPGQAQFEACGLLAACEKFTHADLEHALAFAAAEAKAKGTLEYFDGRRNWRPESISHALSRPIPSAGSNGAMQPCPVVAPELSDDERFGEPC